MPRDNNFYSAITATVLLLGADGISCACANRFASAPQKMAHGMGANGHVMCGLITFHRTVNGEMYGESGSF